jgi:hypothetical protein
MMSWWDLQIPPLSHPMAYSEERTPRPTGLVDVNGKPIMRSPETPNVGFINFDAIQAAQRQEAKPTARRAGASRGQRIPALARSARKVKR